MTSRRQALAAKAVVLSTLRPDGRKTCMNLDLVGCSFFFQALTGA
jgi:hypothetical protein